MSKRGLLTLGFRRGFRGQSPILNATAIGELALYFNIDLPFSWLQKKMGKATEAK